MTDTGADGALVTLADVEEAARRIAGTPIRTPLVAQPEASDEAGATVRLKLESLQRTGSFKIRGASNFIATLPESEAGRGVITYSSGNHAQAVALAARLDGRSATVVMPTTAPEVKSAGARRLGARVEFEGTTSEERRVRAEAIAAEEGLVMVPPFDDPRIIAGQGTVALEVVEDWPDVDTLVVPIGGGGLSSGCAAAFRALRPQGRVIGVEPEGAASMRAAWDAGAPVMLDRIDTIADGLAPVKAGVLTHQHLRALADDVVTVSDRSIRSAAEFLVRRAKLIVEYSGAATLAAVMDRPEWSRGRKVAAVVSGGNLDPALLRELA